jgi:hypothetical protein
MKYKTIAACALVLILLTLRAPMNAETLNEERFIDMDIENSMLWKQETLLAAAQPIIDYYSYWNYGWMTAIHYDEEKSLNILKLDKRYFAYIDWNSKDTDYIVFTVDLVLGERFNGQFDIRSLDGQFAGYYPEWYWVSYREYNANTWKIAYIGQDLPYVIDIPVYSYYFQSRTTAPYPIEDDVLQTYKPSGKKKEIVFDMDKSALYDDETLMQAAQAIIRERSECVWASLAKIYYRDEESQDILSFNKEMFKEDTDYFIFSVGLTPYIEIAYLLPPTSGGYMVAYREHGSDTWGVLDWLGIGF